MVGHPRGIIAGSIGSRERYFGSTKAEARRVSSTGSVADH